MKKNISTKVMDCDELKYEQILYKPFDFRNSVISQCRRMDREDVYQWIAEDEMKIIELKKEKEILTKHVIELQKKLSRNDD